MVEEGDRRAAVAEAVRRARPGGRVLVAGKGHEQGQEIGGVVHPVRRPGRCCGEALRGADRECRPMIPLTLAEVAAAVGGTLADGPDPAAR